MSKSLPRLRRQEHLGGVDRKPPVKPILPCVCPRIENGFKQSEVGNIPGNPLLPEPFLFQESSLLEFRECLLQLLLSVHHDRAVPSDGLLKRFSRNQQEADSVVSGLNRDLVVWIEKDERA